ncbi:hypothetical protein [Allostreptomyces psammosilenae]|uniref:Putative FlaG/YvyC family protein n=1 Tax=Allostreptomyces psammosilenae TaxID=1892865 RepID=A0A852ZXW1_9ACTN|nr:hypothetical protein [Allostreptomyces psammosilenae]NYI06080.1 putative FlaG/YvyC family protein [Allostreptomyces psammosilenae]
MSERNELMIWLNTTPPSRWARIGKGKTPHLSKFNDETLCGRVIDPDKGSAYIEHEESLELGGAPCASCWKKMKAEVDAMDLAEESATEGAEGEEVDVPAKKTEDDMSVVREQVEANIERIPSLVEADNMDGAKELHDETELLIQKLPREERMPLRLKMKAAGEPQEKPEEKPVASTEVVSYETRDYTTVEGVPELIELGTTRMVEGVNLHLRTADLAKDIAGLLLDIWRRISRKDGMPDLRGDTDAAKKATSAMLKAVGTKLKDEQPADDYDVEQAVKKLTRAIQHQRSDVRAEYLRGLDADTPEAEEERKGYAAILANKPPNVDVSAFLADFYRVKLKGQTELARERWHQKKALEAAGEGVESELEEEETDERVAKVVQQLVKDIKAARPEDFESASEETKEQLRAQLEEINRAIKAMITAVI